MRAIATFILCLVLPIPAPAATPQESAPAPEIPLCGLYSIETFGQTTSYSLKSAPVAGGYSHIYSITNTETPLVEGMVSQSCYCVRGVPSLDPDFAGDSTYQLLVVTGILSGPRPASDCPLSKQ